MTNGRFGLQRSQRCQYWSTHLLWCTRYPPSLSGKILRRLQPHPDYCCSNVINCSQLCTHNQCNTINTIKTCSEFMPLWVLMTMMFVSIFTMLRCPDCAKVTWQREQLQARAVTRRWGQLVTGDMPWLMNPVSSILAVTNSIKMSSVSTSYYVTM